MSTAALDNPITADLPCRQCQYNLHGLTANGQCPECGTAVSQSLSTELLLFADARWLGRLRQGATCIALSPVLFLLGSFGGGYLSGLMSSVAPVAVCWVVTAGVYFVGTWLLTLKEPDKGLKGRADRPRRYSRSCLLFATILIVGGIVFIVSGVADAGYIAEEICVTALIAGFLLAAAGWFATLRHLNRLAPRLPDAGIVRLVRLISYGWALSAGTLATLVLGAVTADSWLEMHASTVRRVAIYFWIGGWAGVSIFLLLSLFLVLRLIRRLKTVAAAGRRMRATSTGASPEAANFVAQLF